jgi:DegV family protein with EDD domain
MSDFILTCCTPTDLPDGWIEKHNIPEVPFHVLIDGRDYLEDHGKTIPYKVFYDMLRKGTLPTTSQPSVAQYIEFFEPLVKEGKKILHLAFSSGISGAYNCACLARKQLLEKYPDMQLHIVDSLAACGGYGLFVMSVCQLRDDGCSYEDAIEWAENNRLKVHHWFYSFDLTHFYRGGRISKTSQIFGTLLQICPLMNVSNVGKLVIREKYRGRKKVLLEIFNKMKTFADGGVSYSGKCIINHSDCPEDALELASMIEEAFPNLDGKVIVEPIGMLIGSHTGPGTIALFFYGDERVD